MRFLPRRRRWCLLAVLALLLVALAWWFEARPTVLQRQFDRIEIGMLRAEVVVVLGSPLVQENYSDVRATKEGIPDYVAVWDHGGDYAILLFDFENRLVKKTYKRRTLLDNAREAWGNVFNRNAPF